MAPEKMNRSQRRKTFPVRPLLTSFPSVQNLAPIRAIRVFPSRITHHASVRSPVHPSADKTRFNRGKNPVKNTKEHKRTQKYLNN
jgi:hypothetical protein